MFTFLIASLLVVNEVYIPLVVAGCSCPDSPQDASQWGYIYIQNAVDDYGYACVMNCTIQAYSGDDSKGLTFFNMQVFEPENRSDLAKVEVIDAKGQTIISVNGETSTTDPRYRITSETAKVSIRITILTDQPVTIFATMQPAGELGTPTPMPTTPMASTTPKYTGGLLHDPRLISHDLMFMIDSTTGQGRDVFATMQNLTISIANQLTITDLANSTGQTRLALRKLDSNQGTIYGIDWKFTLDDFGDKVLEMDWNEGNVSFVTAVKTAISTSFNVSSDVATRKNAQRTIVILTAGSPSDIDDFVKMEEQFKENDVKLLIIGYNIAGTNYANYPWIAYYKAKNASDATVQDILGKNFVTATSLCHTTTDPQTFTLTDNQTIQVVVPDNYQGPKETSPTWPPEMSYQIGRYCNFQDNTYAFKSDGYICFHTYYDLEVEKDYLRIYEGEGKTKKEVVSLTGYDVTGTAFKVVAPATIRFLSDSRQRLMKELRKNEMYRPFYAPVRLRRVDSYGTKKGQLYVAIMTLGLVAAIIVVTKGLYGGIPGFPSGKRIVKTRRDMEKCVQYFGKVAIFVAESKSFQNRYELARRSIECYVKGTEYKLFRIDMDNDKRVKEVCAKHESIFFKRHCAASVYLQDTDWMLVIDTETGVVNPQHCIEEWIDDRVDMIFHERFFNWEISVGTYLVRNTEFSRNFLRKLAEWEFTKGPIWTSNDQGTFMLHLQATLIPNAVWEYETCHDYWKKATNYQTYTSLVTCVRFALGAGRFWPGEVRIYRKAHAWIRDAPVTHDQWSDQDFMLHGWKDNLSNKGCPFESNIDPNQCGANLKEWRWKKQMKVDSQAIKKAFGDAEEYYQAEFPNKGRVIPFLERSDITRCFPLCEEERKVRIYT
ncbi:hypothetical protein RB195_020963 [Necator americanus]|uniref:VWFA domain-containing protein n=1 Tax=Necator americanus TaxID=51031 RepID=A0ABR1CMT3_NECAM